MAGEDNLLQNGGFEPPYHPFRSQEDRLTAVGWAPWVIPPGEGDPPWKNQPPRFGPAEMDGVTAQSLATPFATHEAGLLQQVPAAAGNRYQLRAEGMAWSSEDERPGSRAHPSDVNLQVGIDPTGGLDPTSPLIVWSHRRQPLSRWQGLEVAADAQAAIITVYLKSAPELPKRQQMVFWRNAQLSASGRFRRGVTIVGSGDTHLVLSPEQPQPGDRVTVTASSTNEQHFIELAVRRPDGELMAVHFLGATRDSGRYTWRYELSVDSAGLYDLRLVGDRGARLLAQQLVRVARPDPLEEQAQKQPSGRPRLAYRRVYVLLPPTADSRWLIAAARGGFDGRFTIGFSADDAGVGDLESRQVLAVNPHHWPEALTAAWFHRHYPGARFTPIVANSPEDLEAWLRDWSEEG
jgi:hypothetical protein